MKPLVEIAEGTWAAADEVVRIQTFLGADEVTETEPARVVARGFWHNAFIPATTRVVTPAIPPMMRICLLTRPHNVDYDFDTIEEALEAARRAATVVNATRTPDKAVVVEEPSEKSC